MKLFLYHIVFLILIYKVYSNINAEKRKQLLENLIKNNQRKNVDQKIFHKMNYTIEEIQKIIKDNNFPENYNFITSTSATKIIKNQGKCQSGWAHSTTTALSYRFHKKGIELDLSPQDAISCYKGDCGINNNIDSLLNLIKNGTTTEECFPFSSSEKLIPECPSKCINGSEIKKYYSQNAFQIENNNQNDFKDLVLIIMDQLINEGPITAIFDVHNDFYEFGKDKSLCQNNVYTFDEESMIDTTHMVTIIGYGLLKNKYYWLVQNSYGESWCDNGFIKMEFGQFKEIGFSEPNIERKYDTPIEIPVNYENQDVNCYLNITSSLVDKWVNTLIINFRNSESGKNFTYYCSSNNIKGKKDIISCYFEQKYYYLLPKGSYIFKDYESLGEDNTFNLNNFERKRITFFGMDKIESIGYPHQYVSQEGSKIVFSIIRKGIDETLPYIFADKDAYGKLKDCKAIESNEFKNIIYCNITKSELYFFDKVQEKKMSYVYSCFQEIDSDLFLTMLDTDKYPVFKIRQFLLPENSSYISSDTELIIVAKIDGSLKEYDNEEGIFQIFIDIEDNYTKKTYNTTCSIGIPQINKEFNITCYLVEDVGIIYYKNLFLLPYSIPIKMVKPFEIFIKKTLRAGDPPEPEPKPNSDLSVYFKNILYFYILILLF